MVNPESVVQSTVNPESVVQLTVNPERVVRSTVNRYSETVTQATIRDHVMQPICDCVIWSIRDHVIQTTVIT